MNLDFEQWQFYGAAAAAVAYGAHSKWALYRTKKTAQKAVELSAPTGNGFAKSVTEALERIEVNQARTEQKIDDHIAVHAKADVLHTPRRAKRDNQITEL